MSIHTIGLKYLAFVAFASIYWTQTSWLTLVISLISLGWLVHNITKSQKVEGAENWSAIIIGSGFSGIDAAIKLKEIGVKFTILEKSECLGGTWYDNQYPGAACDIASHLYSFSYYLNPWWTRAYSRQNEIWEYLKNVVDHFNIGPYIKFGTKVESAVWEENISKWIVKTTDGKIFEANFLFSGVGALHVPNDTRFKDDELFEGPKFHTALWRKDVDLKNKKVAVIGTGASSVQVVPNIADEVKELHVFQRTPGWIPAREDYEYPLFVKSLFAEFPFLMRFHRWYYWIKNEIIFYIIFDARRTKLQEFVKKHVFCKHINSVVKDQELAKKLTPSYNIGCKRITPSDKYLETFNKSHVNLVTDKIDRFTSNGIITKSQSGEENHVECDVIILGTGFSVFDSVTKSVTFIGKSGEKLQNEWRNSEQPKAYLGITVPNIPNAFVCHGPNTGLGHNSVIFMLECQNNYSLDCVKKLIKSGYKSMECKQEPFDKFHVSLFEQLKNRVFSVGGCSAWYLNAKGVNWTLWSGDLTEYWMKTRQCNLKDYLLR